MNELPEFPEFKPLELGDEPVIKAFFEKEEPYSDFNFVSMWSWNTDKQIEVSTLHGNLVVKFIDYTSFKPFYSYIGPGPVAETAATLLEHAEAIGIEENLKLVPKRIAETLATDDVFLVEEHRKQFDYVYSFADLAEFKGKKFHNKRRLANKFVEKYGEVEIVEKDAKKEENQVLIFELLTTWNENNNGEKAEDLLQIQKSIIRLFECVEENDSPVVLHTLFIEGKLAAFSLDEPMHDGHVLSHFCKTDFNYTGITEYFNKKLSEKLLNENLHYWNWEQDVDDEALRRMKEGYRPAFYQKKYKVTKKK